MFLAFLKTGAETIQLGYKPVSWHSRGTGETEVEVLCVSLSKAALMVPREARLQAGERGPGGSLRQAR